MRLTNSIKQVFVKSVLDDVPTIDYQELLRNLIMQDAIARLPEPVRVIALDQKQAHFVSDHYYHISANRDDGYESYFGLSMYIKMPTSEYIESYAIQERKREYITAYLAQEKMLNELRQKLKDAINAVSTVKKAKEAMPEFSKYLPQEVGQSNNLPTTIFANLLNDLARAGFPKGGALV